jgi:hypothetical protein
VVAVCPLMEWLIGVLTHLTSARCVHEVAPTSPGCSTWGFSEVSALELVPVRAAFDRRLLVAIGDRDPVRFPRFWQRTWIVSPRRRSTPSPYPDQAPWGVGRPAGTSRSRARSDTIGRLLVEMGVLALAADREHSFREVDLEVLAVQGRERPWPGTVAPSSVTMRSVGGRNALAVPLLQSIPSRVTSNGDPKKVMFLTSFGRELNL